LCPANIGFVAYEVMVCGLQSHSSSDGESDFYFVHVVNVKIIQIVECQMLQIKKICDS